MEIKKFEAYEVNAEDYNDFGEEHAKEVISYLIENQLDGTTLQDAFDKVVRDYDLKGSSEDNELLENVKHSVLTYLADLTNEANNITF